MKKNTLLPKERRILQSLGENIRLARLRRKLSTEMVAERAHLSRSTLWGLERGEANVSIHSLLQVLSVLGFEKELAELAAQDPLGRKLQDAQLVAGKHTRKSI
jgi:transcriptional regulator with XRE-family HTH domain